MKKFLFLLMAGVVFSSGAYAKHPCGCHACGCMFEEKMHKKGGFEEKMPALMSVRAISESPRGTPVSAKGYLTAQLDDDVYNFTDGVTNIKVKIGDKVWQGQRVTPKDEIIIYGKVNKEAGVKVKKLELVK